MSYHSAIAGNHVGQRRRRLQDFPFVRNPSGRDKLCIEMYWCRLVICNVVILALPAGDTYIFNINVVRNILIVPSMSVY